jgi:hypothetical protein
MTVVFMSLLAAGIGSVAGWVATGGHPWKHLAAAAAMWCYVRTVAGRSGISPA